MKLEPEKNERKRYIITITTSYRKDSSNIESKNQIKKENINDKKYSSYSYVPIRNEKNQIKEKEVEKKIDNKNKQPFATLPKTQEKEKEKNNVSITYISNNTDNKNNSKQ